jgi:hypothetical protein
MNLSITVINYLSNSVIKYLSNSVINYLSNSVIKYLNPKMLQRGRLEVVGGGCGCGEGEGLWLWGKEAFRARLGHRARGCQEVRLGPGSRQRLGSRF